MIVFAIRHIPTGKLMPVRKTGRGGGTHVSFDDKAPPRLFLEKRHAKFCLNWWVGGKATQTYDDEGPLGINVVPQPDRKVEDLEIIPIYLETNSDNFPQA